MAKVIRLGKLISPAASLRCGTATFPVLSMTMRKGIVLQSVRFNKSLASIDQINCKIVKKGQLVIGFPIDEGVLYLQKAVPMGIISPAYNVWNIYEETINADYLELCLHSPQSMNYYKNHLQGTTARRCSIPLDVLLKLPVQVPSIKEQVNTVNKLRLIDDTIDKYTDMLNSTKMLEKSKHYVDQKVAA